MHQPPPRWTHRLERNREIQDVMHQVNMPAKWGLAGGLVLDADARSDLGQGVWDSDEVELFGLVLDEPEQDVPQVSDQPVTSTT